MGFFDFFRTNINDGIKKYENTPGAVLLDVRTPEEYGDYHIKGSVNLPLDKISDVDSLIKDKTTPLFVYCYSGMRSGKAVSYLKKVGYKNASDIGGIRNYRIKEAD